MGAAEAHKRIVDRDPPALRKALAQTIDREFRLETRIEPAGSPFREIWLETDRTFVPDDIQKNGDRRRLGLRIYGFYLR